MVKYLYRNGFDGNYVTDDEGSRLYVTWGNDLLKKRASKAEYILTQDSEVEESITKLYEAPKRRRTNNHKKNGKKEKYLSSEESSGDEMEENMFFDDRYVEVEDFDDFDIIDVSFKNTDKPQKKPFKSHGKRVNKEVAKKTPMKEPRAKQDYEAKQNIPQKNVRTLVEVQKEKKPVKSNPVKRLIENINSDPINQTSSSKQNPIQKTQSPLHIKKTASPKPLRERVPSTREIGKGIILNPMKTADFSVQRMIESVKIEVQNRLKKDLDLFEALSVREEDSGKSCFVKAMIGLDQYIHIRMLKDGDKKPSLGAVHNFKTKQEKIEYFEEDDIIPEQQQEEQEEQEEEELKEESEELPLEDEESKPNEQESTIDTDSLGDNLASQFFKMAQTTPEENAYYYKNKENKWTPVTWCDYRNQVLAGASALIEIGLLKGDRVCIAAKHSNRWAVCFFSAISLGAIPSGLHFEHSPETLKKEMDLLMPHLLIVDKNNWEKLKSVGLSSSIENVVLLEDFELKAPKVKCHVWDSIVEKQQKDKGVKYQKLIQESLNKLEDDSVAFMSFTYGTQSNSKCVELTHKSIIASTKSFGESNQVNSNDKILCTQTLSHINYQIFNLFLPIFFGTNVFFGAADIFRNIVEELVQVQPTIHLATPFMWRKFYSAVSLKIPDAQISKTGATRKISLLKSLGLNRCKLTISTGSHLSNAVLEYFENLERPIHSLYSLSEMSGFVSYSYKRGTLGKLLPGIEIKFEEEEEQESENKRIYLRGDSIFTSYRQDYKSFIENPIDQYNWLKTDDFGRLDEEDFLILHSKADEAFKLSTGEVVYPSLIESVISEHSFISNTILFGSGKEHLAALIEPDWDVLQMFAKKQNLSLQQSLVSPTLQKVFTTHLEKNTKVRRYTILKEPLTYEKNELNPFGDVKRDVVKENNKGIPIFFF